MRCSFHRISLTRFRYLAVVVPCVLLSHDAFAQSGQVEKAKGHFLRAGYQPGYVLPTNSFVKGDNLRGEPIEWYHAVRLEFGWQSDGSEVWQQIYNAPSYGIGLYGANFFNDEEVGTPSALYGFFNWPFKRWTRSALNAHLGFGLAQNFKGFDPETNPHNTAMGAESAAYIDVGFTYNLAFSHRWEGIGGFSVTHFSNGGTKKPNSGYNMIGVGASMSYNFQREPIVYKQMEVPPYEKNWELILTGSAGIRNMAVDLRADTLVGKYFDEDFLIFNITAAAARQLGHMPKVAAGIDVAYDESVKRLVDLADGERDDAPAVDFGDHLSLSGFAGYEHVAGRGSLLLQLGYTFLRKDVKGQVPKFYQRLGLKYHVFRNTFLGINVRFQEFSRANNLEFTLGQRWR